ASRAPSCAAKSDRGARRGPSGEIANNLWSCRVPRLENRDPEEGRQFHTVARMRAAESLQRGDGRDLDQKLLAHQPIDDQQRVGRIGPAGKQAREFTRAVLEKLADVLRMHEVAREFHDIGKACALRSE